LRVAVDASVAGGVRVALTFFENAFVSRVIDPELESESHIDTTSQGFMPFAIGDVQPQGAFIHVFDEPALELLARKLDTVTDFTRYLIRRERIMRSGHLLTGRGRA
jgi:hypothetical protein